jgi:hypothetical protein
MDEKNNKLLYNSKSQGLSINFIIIAALGLIVLIVIAFIFRGESSRFVKNLECPARNGVCLEGKVDCPEDKQVKIYTNDCNEVEFKEVKYIAKKPEKGPGQCCIPIG